MRAPGGPRRWWVDRNATTSDKELLRANVRIGKYLKFLVVPYKDMPLAANFLETTSDGELLMVKGLIGEVQGWKGPLHQNIGTTSDDKLLKADVRIGKIILRVWGVEGVNGNG